MRVCSRCDQAKPVAGFHKWAAGRDGLRPDCKTCVIAYMKARRDAMAVAVKTIPTSKPCTRCGVVKARDQFAKLNSSKHGLQSLCRDCQSRASKAWIKANPERNRAKCRASTSRRNARKLNVTVEHFTGDDLRHSYAKRGLEACVYCDGPYEQDDHVIPLSRGGVHACWNLVTACAYCNQSKCARDVFEFLGSREPHPAVIEAVSAYRESIQEG